MTQSESSAKKHKPALKYRLNELLSRYEAKKRRPIKTALCEDVGITEKTWSNWANLKFDVEHDLPYLAVVKLAQRFGVKPEELCNVEVKLAPIQPDLFGAAIIKQPKEEQAA